MRPRILAIDHSVSPPFRGIHTRRPEQVDNDEVTVIGYAEIGGSREIPESSSITGFIQEVGEVASWVCWKEEVLTSEYPEDEVSELLSNTGKPVDYDRRLDVLEERVKKLERETR